MSRRTRNLDDELYGYLLSVSLREPEVLRRLREETANVAGSEMQIAPEQGQFMAFLARLIGARRALELGVFTGYSALAVASALPPDGTLVACELRDDFTGMARRYWREAGVDGRIDLRMGPAEETLAALVAQKVPPFDFAFIDADKEPLDRYYERCLELLRPGGLILIDNVLWDGKAADAKSGDPAVVAIRRLNAKLLDDQRIDLSLLPIADGLTLARKR
jgi:caffeoyl-CoA O-methyltransferase